MSALPQFDDQYLDEVPTNERVSAEAYLQRNHASPQKLEFVNGHIFALAGASMNHNTIVANIIHALKTQKGNRPCRILASDIQIPILSTNSYRYPDVTMICGQPQIADEKQFQLTNPTLLVEVISPTTQQTDYTDKLYEYRQLDSLQVYLIVHQDQPRVDVYQRHGEQWLLDTIEGLDATVLLNTIDFELPMHAIYDDIDFTEE